DAPVPLLLPVSCPASAALPGSLSPPPGSGFSAGVTSSTSGSPLTPAAEDRNKAERTPHSATKVQGFQFAVTGPPSSTATDTRQCSPLLASSAATGLSAPTPRVSRRGEPEAAATAASSPFPYDTTFR
ncbi:unnamed protein product, partial [Ectocarpus sp. 8 AP-2014]